MVLAGSFVSRSGVLTARVSIMLRAFLSWSAEVIRKEELNAPIALIDPRLSFDVMSFLRKEKVSMILPSISEIIPEGYEFKVIHMHHDGSELGAAYFVY